MAKQLYDYWFVQFDFPNEDGKPYKSSGGVMVWNEKLKREIPQGWNTTNICDISDILSGGTPSKAVAKYWEEGSIPFFGPTDCDGSIFQLETSDHITEEGLKHCSSSLFQEGDIILTARGSIGKLVIVGTPMAMNQSCYALRSKKKEYEYLYFLTVQLIECLKAKGSGSVFKSIIASDIETSTLCIGDEKTISAYCKTVSSLFRQIKMNLQEINVLTKQRDELLPLLMNGQASVNYHLSVIVIPFLASNYNGRLRYGLNLITPYHSFLLPERQSQHDCEGNEGIGITGNAEPSEIRPPFPRNPDSLVTAQKTGHLIVVGLQPVGHLDAVLFERTVHTLNDSLAHVGKA